LALSRHLILILVSLISTIVSAQPTLIDSIELVLQNDDDLKSQIDYHLGLARMHMLGGDVLTGLQHAENAIEIARTIGSKKYEAIATVFVGSLHYNLSRPYEELHKKARELALESKDPDAIGFSTYTWVESGVFDPSTCIGLLEEVLDKYEESLTIKNLGNVYKAIAWEYEKNGEFYKAEQAYLTSIDLFLTIAHDPEIDPELGRISAQLFDKGKSNLMQSRIYLGELYSSRGRHEEAITYGLKAFEATSSESDTAYLSAHLADMYRTAGKIDDALSNYNIAVQLYRKRNEPAFLSTTLQGLGHTYFMMKEYDEAEKRYLESYELEKEVPNSAAEALTTLARLYKNTGRLELSIDTYIKADSIFETVDNELARITCQLSIAEAQGRQGLYDLAYDKIQNQITLLRKIQNYPLLYDSYSKLSNIDKDRERYNDAIQYGKQALEVATKNNNLSLISEGHSLLSNLYNSAKQYQDAFFHLGQHQIYKDSLFTQNALQKLKEEQVRQNIDEHIDEKEKAEEIATLLASQNRIYFFVSILLLSLLAIGTYLFIQLRKTRKQLQDQNLQLQELNQTKDRFFGIIAHDIRSPILALESVDEQMQYYVQKGNFEKAKKISGMVGSTARQLNALLDNLLNWALLQTGMIIYHPNQVNISEIINETLSLLSTNAEMKNVNLENLGDSNTSAYADTNAIQTILRNLIGNALKFSPKNSNVLVQSTTVGLMTQITIEDQGQGMSQSEIDKLFSIDKKSKKGTAGERGTGLGMILVKDLIHLNKGTIEIESQVGKGTKMIISLPNQERAS